MGLSSIFYLLLGSRACGPNRAGIKSVQLTNLCSLPRSAIIGESAMASNLTGITFGSLRTPGTRAVIDSAETAALWASINAQTTAMPAPQYTYDEVHASVPKSIGMNIITPEGFPQMYVAHHTCTAAQALRSS